MLSYDMLLDLDKSQLREKIKHVAIYPRRSRPSEDNVDNTDIEKDLMHQIKRLKELCVKNNWSYEDYTEIGSGENIDDRPRLKQLLEDMADGKFDAVAVSEFSRLTRGSGTDQDRVLLTFRRNNVVILEGDHEILNPFNKSDLDKIRMLSMFSNYEYSNTVERTTQGKRVRATEGWWVSGSPPYGYIKDRKTKKLVIHEEQAKIYKEMILAPYISGESASEIAWGLNKAKIPSPRGGMWENTTILRMLKSEVYQGHIFYNKTIGSRNSRESINKIPYRKQPEEKWKTCYNAHPPLQSVQERVMVMRELERKTPKQGEVDYHDLSGLVKCGYCNKTLIIAKNYNQKRLFKKCPCGENRGGEVDILEDIIFVSAYQLKGNLNNANESNIGNSEKMVLIKEIEKLDAQVLVENKALERIDEAVVYGFFDMQKATSEKERIFKLIYDLEEEIVKKKNQLDSFNVMSNREKILRIDEFIDKKDEMKEDGSLRELYLTIIDSIKWKRIDDDTIDIKVNFL